MDLIVAYIGLSQAIFAIIMMLTKKPLKIADGVLSVLLFVFAVTFGLDILQRYEFIPANRWFISLSLRMLCAPLLFLYTKHITNDLRKFNKKDYLHALPSVILIILFLVLRLQPENNILPLEKFYQKYIWIRYIYGRLFFALIFYYVIYSVVIVIRFKKQIKNNYSYSSFKISLDWLLIMIFLFVVLIVLIIVSTIMYENGTIDKKVFIFRHMLELFHVYVLSIWGFHQKQLIANIDLPQNDLVVPLDVQSNKYIKSGLKEEDAKKYLEQLLKYMNESEVWKDPELSIAKLSDYTSISKHKLSEVLNEHLGKSFYIFINEYRIEYAKILLQKKEYSNWSILAIAFECGFNSKAAFNSFFKKHTLLTPSEFKKSFEFKP